MGFKYLGLIAVAALIAACETAPEESAATGGAGGAAAPATTAAPASTAAPSPSASAAAEAMPMKAKGPASGTQEDLEVNVGDRVFFGYDKSNIMSEAQTVLQRAGGMAQEISVGQGEHRGPLRRTGHPRIQPGARRTARQRGQGLPDGAWHRPQPRQDHILRQGTSSRAGLQRGGLGAEPPWRDQGHGRGQLVKTTFIHWRQELRRLPERPNFA